MVSPVSAADVEPITAALEAATMEAERAPRAPLPPPGELVNAASVPDLRKVRELLARGVSPNARSNALGTGGANSRRSAFELAS